MCLNGGGFGRPDLKRHLNEVPGPVNQYLIPAVLVEISSQKMVQYFVPKLTKKALCGTSRGFLSSDETATSNIDFCGFPCLTFQSVRNSEEPIIYLETEFI